MKRSFPKAAYMGLLPGFAPDGALPAVQCCAAAT